MEQLLEASRLESGSAQLLESGQQPGWVQELQLLALELKPGLLARNL